MAKTYELVPDQEEKYDADNVSVKVTESATWSEDKIKTVAQMKLEVTRLEQKLVAVANHKASVEAELAAVEAEAAKFELTLQPKEEIIEK